MQTSIPATTGPAGPPVSLPALLMLAVILLLGPSVAAQDAPPYKTPYNRGNSLAELKGIYWKSLTTERRRYMNGSLLLGHFVAKQLLVGFNFNVLTEKQRELDAYGREYVLDQDLIYLYGPVLRYHFNNAPTSFYMEASLLRGSSKSIIKFGLNDGVRVFHNVVLAAGLTFPIRRSFKGLVSAGLVKQWGAQGVGVWPQAGALYTFGWK